MELWLIVVVTVGILVVVVATLLTLKRKQTFRLDPVLSLAFILVFFGNFMFGDDHLVGYLFIGSGIILSIINVTKNSKKK
jgi:uncharacterized membrane protein